MSEDSILCWGGPYAMQGCSSISFLLSIICQNPVPVKAEEER